MPELRKDLITREWVVIAHERARRPSDFSHQREAALVTTSDHAFCPFCPGHESASPDEIASYREEGSRQWQVRVVANKFPALCPQDWSFAERRGLYENLSGVGAHEVIIETPDHGVSLARLEVAQVERVLRVYRERYLALREDAHHQYILPFRNHGKVAGASIEHAHSQIIATPVIPQQAQIKIEGVRRYQEYSGRCVYCDIVAEELRDGERLIATNDSFVAFAPYASRYPYELWIVPRERDAHFTHISETQLHDLAAITKETLLRLDLCLDDPPYNLMLLTTDFSDNFHWHIEIIPRLTVAAGFELGTGIYINVVQPEQAAADLRAVAIDPAQ
jgi:UDPglucose--hexose-1-phosphate uridylyltransferase